MPEPADQPAERVPPGAVGAMPNTAPVPTSPGGPIAPLEATAATEVDAAPTRRLGILGWFSVLWLVGITGAAILAPWLPLADPDRSVLEIVRIGPVQPGHPLGGDGLGRDMLARVIFGARTSLLVAGGAVLFGLVIGGLLGLLAGYFRGKIDTVLTTLFNVLLSIPALVLALSLVAVFASSDQASSHTRRLVVLILALGIVTIPILGRITRASTLSWAERDFVKAAEVIGAGHVRIMFREVLPNVLPAMMSITLLGIAVALVAEGALSLLGVGVVEEPTWGNMIAIGRSDLARAPHIVGIPSVAIFLTVLSLNSLGDVIRARFDVREAAL
jgi:peptide/nickel transport system permease protein